MRPRVLVCHAKMSWIHLIQNMLLAQALLSQGIRQTLRIMSRLVEGYQDFAHAFTMHLEQRISVPEFLRIMHRPPEAIITPEGQSVPLTGLIELFAVARAIGDTDVFGGSGTNAGFIWIRNDRGVITSARTIKIDPGLAFQVLRQNDEETHSKYCVQHYS